MKREIAMIAFVLLGMGMTASAQFGKKINLGKALQAGKDVVSAVTLSDADIANMSKEYMTWMDTHNPLTKPDTEYGKRLEKLTGHIKEVDGLKVNFGVYEVVDVNAFACGDGSVRICAGLMGIMTDDEVMAVVGHEIGHVIHTDSGQFLQALAIFRIRLRQRIVSIHPLHILPTHSCNISIRKSYSFSSIRTGLNNLTYIDFLTTNFKLRISSCSTSHSTYNSSKNQNLFFHVVWLV